MTVFAALVFTTVVLLAFYEIWGILQKTKKRPDRLVKTGISKIPAPIPPEPVPVEMGTLRLPESDDEEDVEEEDQPMSDDVVEETPGPRDRCLTIYFRDRSEKSFEMKTLQEAQEEIEEMEYLLNQDDIYINWDDYVFDKRDVRAVSIRMATPVVS